MTPVISNEADLYFERGGPTYRLMQRLTTKWGLGHSVHHRILGFLLITWVPLLFFAWIEGRALGSTPQESFLLDFASYARFFLAVPLLVVAELVIGPRLTGAGLHFVQGGFVRPEDYPSFDQAISRAAKWRESFWAEMILLGMAVTGAWTFTTESVYGIDIATWRSAARSTDNGPGVSITGLWYHLVSVPILQFFWFRWIWRLIVWGRFLWTVSRLNLNLVATHADQAGGLGFLGTVHTSFGIFGFALSSVLSAEAAFLIVFENANIETFKVSYITLLVIVELMFLGPLLMFFPILSRARLSWLRAYSLLVVQYNRAFHEKWIERKTHTSDPLLGSADIQSLADLGASFEYIRSMKVVPFSLRVIIQMAIITSLPCLPLLLLVMPVAKIIEMLGGAVF